MKIVAIGDIHGRSYWKTCIQEPTDQLVFIGDYFDAYDIWITPEEEIANFKEILTLKRDNPDMVTLLIGNHDYHYLSGIEQQYSRYNAVAAAAIREVLEDALDVMQICCVYDNILFNHAGLTKTWCRNNAIELATLEHSLNQKFVEDRLAFGFLNGIGDENGSDVRQSPLWVRPDQLLADKIDGYKQVVGHTKQQAQIFRNNVAFIDVPGAALIIEDSNTVEWR
jgi:predicted MPP superfamily phosphohydrolase